MVDKMEVLRFVANFFPKNFRENFYLLISETGLNFESDTLLGIITILTAIYFLFSLVFFLNENVNKPFLDFSLQLTKEKQQAIILSFFSYIIFVFVVYFVIMTILYSYLSFVSDLRKNVVENVLPDFLSLVSSNIKAGMSIEQAIWQAAKPEFGILSIEVKAAIKEAFAGTPLDKALLKLSNRFNSRMLKRAILLINEAWRSGGELSLVLEKTADEAKEVLINKKEIKTNLIVIVIFIAFASTIGVPIIFAVTSLLVETLEKTFVLSSTSLYYGNFSLSFSKPPLSSKDFQLFSVIVIFINVFIASFIVSIAYTGSKKQAFRFFPFMLFIAYTVFYLATSIIKSLIITF